MSEREVQLQREVERLEVLVAQLTEALWEIEEDARRWSGLEVGKIARRALGRDEDDEADDA